MSATYWLAWAVISAANIALLIASHRNYRAAQLLLDRVEGVR